MKNQHPKRRILRAAIAVCALLVLGSGCGASDGVSRSETAPTAASGAALWAANCGRCHNIRSPTSLDAEQWEAATLHMRVRANLTGEDADAILMFLQSAQ